MSSTIFSRTELDTAYSLLAKNLYWGNIADRELFNSYFKPYAEGIQPMKKMSEKETFFFASIHVQYLGQADLTHDEKGYDSYFYVIVKSSLS